jgi:bZIP transcription factor
MTKTTEVDDVKNKHDDLSEVIIKCEESSSPTSSSSLSTPSTPLTTWPYSALLTPQSIISPSQLVLTDFIKRPASAASLSSTTAGDQPPPQKKVKRKARTEEEKEARAYERTMRNRRAAQESRDRKKRQFEVLEEENRRLQEENQQMKRRIEQLEQRQQQFTPPTPNLQYPDLVVVKSEDQEEEGRRFSSESFESTFHPAAMELTLNDQQCLSTSLKNLPSPLLFPSLMTTFLLYHQIWMNLHHPLFSTLFSLTTRISLMNNGMLAYSPATFNSLNTGSLFTGAENKLCNSWCH